MVRGHYLMTQTSKAQAIREGSFGFLNQSIARRMDAKMKAELATVGIDIKLFAGLRMLAEEDGMNQRMLGKRLNFPEYFTSRNVDAMVKAGFAERRPDPDSRRSFLVFLTEKGREKADCLPPVIKRVNAEILSELSEAEQTQLITLLQKVAGIGPETKG